MRYPAPRPRLALGLALLFLCASAVPSRTDGTRPDCYVLSVGVDNYAKANKLQGCVNDARNIAGALRSQQGQLFSKVDVRILVDAKATRAQIGQEMARLQGRGQAGDFVVLFLSGHGGRTNARAWYFLPWDYDSQAHANFQLGERQILAAANAMVEKGKKVLIIIDACFAGQLRLTARDYLNRYRNPRGGGLILMLSSMPTQTSAALGQYSAFAKAVVDGLSGAADLDGDGYITLREVRRYAYDRTYQLVRERGLKSEQDGECDWSLSVSENLRLAVVQKPKVWEGSENLSGYGRLAFQFYQNGRAVMIDTQGSHEGTWQIKGKQVTLRFFGGQVIYSGTIEGSLMSGTARNDRNTWTWSVQFVATNANSTVRR